MRFKQLAWAGIYAITATALAACNIGATPAPTMDVNAIYTEAAQTAVAGFAAQMTQTAQAMPPTAMPTNTALATFTLLPTFPPVTGSTPLGVGTPGAATPLAFSTPVPTLAGPQCNDSGFMGDVTIPDGSEIHQHEDFEKIWALKNTGTCNWDEGFSFVFVAGENLSGGNIVFGTDKADLKYFAKPGETVEFSIWMDAGDASLGEHSGCWRMKSDTGYYFGTYACYKITVIKAAKK